MTKEKIQLITGALLHDVGKVIYHHGTGRKHSAGGYEFLKEELHIDEPNILESVKYHHRTELENSEVPEGSYAYITYIADRITAATERREGDTEEADFEVSAPLRPVFNVLNGNNAHCYYHPGTLENTINYPTEEKELFDRQFYEDVKQGLTENLCGMTWTKEYINSLLEVLEKNCTYLPSSAGGDGSADISLYDHLKLTAAVASCVYDYLQEKGILEYKKELFLNADAFYEKPVFLLFSMDVSGIQDFIYTIHSEGALKNLRARSFYLEIMMEHMIDTLLQRVQLSRANLIYSGGGHCYILLPDTENVKALLTDYEEELNEWLLKRFDISLYVAAGMAECSANGLKNEPDGSYSEIYRRISNMISEKKAHRYCARQIRYLNAPKKEDFTRECKICKRMERLDETNLCEICSDFINFSKNILYTDYFLVSKAASRGALPLPFGAYLTAGRGHEVENRMQEDDGFLRIYTKNRMDIGTQAATKIWVGNYTTGETFKELASRSEGIKRLGILRADVDNLGKAFVSGFENAGNGNRYVSLSRSAVLSRQLSLFFKYYINDILTHPVYSIGDVKKERRKASIVYSGGDDLFIVGAWDDVLELSVDIKRAFEAYTEGSLSISAGIGIYHPGFPIHISAAEVAELEEESKMLPDKNAVTILPDGDVHEIYDKEQERSIEVSDGTYSWTEFIEVIGEKYKLFSEYFEHFQQGGNGNWYYILELIRGKSNRINLARLVYLLAGMEPEEQAGREEKILYKKLSRKLYQWIKEERDCRQLKTAIKLFAYMTRQEEIE